MDAQVEAVSEYIRRNPDTNQNTMARQFQVTRDRLRTRVEGDSPKRGPNVAKTKSLTAEESAMCRYIDFLGKVNLAVLFQLITDAGNYILSLRSALLETAQTVGKIRSTHFIKCNN